MMCIEIEYSIALDDGLVSTQYREGGHAMFVLMVKPPEESRPSPSQGLISVTPRMLQVSATLPMTISRPHTATLNAILTLISKLLIVIGLGVLASRDYRKGGVEIEG